MSLISIKWILLLPGAFVTMLGLSFLGHKSVHAELGIHATPEQIWAVLTDTETYKEWNPVMIPEEGELAEGNKLKYKFIQDGEASTIPSKVKKIIPNKLLNQGGGFPGVLTFDHQYILEPVAGGTKVTIHEEYRGIGVHFWDPAPVEKAYEVLLDALNQRVISLYGPADSRSSN